MSNNYYKEEIDFIATVEDIKSRHKLSSLINTDTMKKVSSKEFCSPCPFCGGTDRFVYWSGDKWLCRKCTPKGGDVVDYLAKSEKMTVVQYCIRFFNDNKDNKETVKTEGKKERVARPNHTLKKPPDTEWQDKAWRGVDSAHCDLLVGIGWLESNPQAERGALPHLKAYEAEVSNGKDKKLAYKKYHSNLCRHIPNGSARAYFELKARGITKQGIDNFLLGYSKKRDAIVIPHVIGSILWGVRFRCLSPRAKSKYSSFKGSKISLYGAGSITPSIDTLIVVEGEMDTVLLSQFVPENIAVVTMGGGTTTLSTSWKFYLLGIKRVLLGLDNDDTGKRGMAKWFDSVPICQAMPAWANEGEDVTDMWKGGVDLQAWVNEAINTTEATQTKLQPMTQLRLTNTVQAQTAYTTLQG